MLLQKITGVAVVVLLGVVLAQAAYIVHAHRQSAAWQQRVWYVLDVQRARYDSVLTAVLRDVAAAKQQAERMRQERDRLQQALQQVPTATEERRIARDTTRADADRLVAYAVALERADSVIALQARVIVTLHEEAAAERRAREQIEVALSLAHGRIRELEAALADAPVLQVAKRSAWPYVAAVLGGVVVGQFIGRQTRPVTVRTVGAPGGAP